MAAKTRSTIPARIVNLRQSKGLSQADVIDQINNLTGSKISKSLISHWETGLRSVPVKYIPALCQILGCTKQYLYGISDSPNSVDSSGSESEAKLELVPSNSIHEYDDMPLYVEFSDGFHIDGWAIYTRYNNTLHFPDTKIQLGNNNLDMNYVKFYFFAPSYALGVTTRKSTLSYGKVMNNNLVFVKYKSSSPSIRAMYDGMYHHNETRTALINNEGLVLPYEGINKFYVCYTVDDAEKFNLT